VFCQRTLCWQPTTTQFGPSRSMFRRSKSSIFAELRRIPYDQIVSWGYGDFVFGAGFDIISSMTKARRYGFHEAVDTEEMFFRMFDELRASKVIP
jgi:hypothetical protein